MTDPRIRQDFATFKGGKALYVDRCPRFAELTREQPFDATELLRTNADYRALLEFLRQHAPGGARGAAIPAVS